MAATVITPVKVQKNTLFSFGTTKALSASDGGVIDYEGAVFDKLVLAVENASSSGAEVLTVKKGSGVFAGGDLEVSVAQSSTSYLVLEAGRFVNDINQVIVSGTANLKLAAVILP